MVVGSIVDAYFKQRKRYKVAITEKQIGILEWCASAGIVDMHELKEYLSKRYEII